MANLHSFVVTEAGRASTISSCASVRLAGIAEFERELTQERIRSGIGAAKVRGKRLGRQPRQRPKSDRLAPKVLVLDAQGRGCRLVGRETGLSKNTVVGIVKQDRSSILTRHSSETNLDAPHS